MTVFLRTLFFVTLGLAAWQAHADVYGFVDEQPPPLLGALLITGSSTMTLLKCWC